MTTTMNNEFHRAFCTAVGHLVVNWALVEQALDMSIATIYHTAGGRRIRGALPLGERRKVRFLKQAFKTIPELASLIPIADPLLSRAKTVVHARHTVVHGALTAFDDKTNTITFTMLDSKLQMHHEVIKKLTFQQILDAAGECVDLTTKLLALVAQIIAAPMPKYTGGNFLRRVLRKLIRALSCGK